MKGLELLKGLVFEGLGAKSVVLCATWMEKYQYSFRFGRSRWQKLRTVSDLDAKVLIF